MKGKLKIKSKRPQVGSVRTDSPVALARGEQCTTPRKRGQGQEQTPLRVSTSLPALLVFFFYNK